MLVCEAMAATYYVDGSRGSDSNSGQSTTAAWQTLNKANTTLRAGDTVLIRSGTYHQVISPSNSGVAGSPITYKNYAGETVTVRGVSGQMAPVNLKGSYIVIDGLTLKHISPGSGTRTALVYIWGENYDHNTIRNCTLICQGPGTYDGSREYGIRLSYADYTLLENNTISGWPILGIANGYGASHTTIRGNTIRNTQSSAIDIGGGSYGPHYILIENNLVDYVYQEDGIQFEHNYNLPSGTTDYDSNQKVIIRNNVFRYCQENAVDLKGAANIVIEGNTFYGCVGDNEGPGDGLQRAAGAQAIMHGTGTGSRDVIIRRNVIYDNLGGILAEAGYQIYQNTIVYNNRDYTGSNSSWVATSKPAFAGIAAWNNRTNVNIKNNIVGGHNGAEVAVRQTAPSLTIDGNLYFNEGSPRLVHYVGDSNWHVETWANWPLQLANPILARGCDVHAWNTNPQFVNVPADPGGLHTQYDFHLRSTSPAIDAGQFLTTASGSGSGTSLVVADSRYFCDGYGLVPGDTIQLAGQTATARVTGVNYGTHTLSLDRSLSWTSGQGVALAYAGSRPDIGAREYGGSAVPTTYTLNVSATNGTVTKSPNQTSYPSGQTVTLTATPHSGYTFSGWSGDLTGTTNPATLVMNANKSVTAEFTAAPVTYTLTISATNGTITRSPDQTSYTSGQTVTLTAVPSAGYAFSGWSGDLTGTTNPATLVMNTNKTVSANFTAVPVLYMLTIQAINGTITRVPDQSSYTAGQIVTLTATPNTGYAFSGWSGDASGTSSTTIVVMDADKTVTASFTAARYVLTVSAVHGTVTQSPNQADYNYGQAVALQAVPDPNYIFTGWSGDASGTSISTTIVMDSDKTVVANFASRTPDRKPPALANCSPAPDAIQVPPNSLVVLHLRDEGEGVDAASVSIRVNDHLVQTGDVDTCRTDFGVCRRLGTKADYTYVFQPNGLLGYSRKVPVAVVARDLAGNPMSEEAYSFSTEMYSFGPGKSVAPDQTRIEQGQPATASDGQGNVWVAWQAGAAGQRHIYAARLTPEADAYGPAVQLSHSTGDHCNPALARDAAGIWYAVWQENPRGVWDIYLAISGDGAMWSAPMRIADPSLAANQAVDQVHPVVTAGRQSTNLVAVAWQDSRAGNQDIYVACSTSAFATVTVARVTFDSADQTEPVVAIDSHDTVFLLWTDARTGGTSIYGAASNNGPWTNVPVTAGPGSRTQPALAVGWVSSALHMAWVDDVGGDPDIFYVSSPGLPASPLAGTDIVDDTAGAAQQAPALAVAAQSEETDRVFVCWQDERNVAFSGDTDLYGVELSLGGLATNVLVGDGGTNSNQRDVALAFDGRGYPCLIWNDSTSKSQQIFSTGTTYMDSVPLAEKEISAPAGGVVGTAPESAVTLNDVSVVIPPQACPFDVTISIRRLRNPRTYATETLRVYDFGPSGLTFAQPVTITIPYGGRLTGKVKASWFDAAANAFTDEGITNAQEIRLASGLHALRFNATHFTTYAVTVDGRPAGGLSARQKTAPAHY